MGHQCRNEPDIAVRVWPRHIKDAVCQSLTHCVFSLMGVDALGLPPGAFETWYDDRTGDVRVMWPEGERRHDGVLQPTKQAVLMFMLNDDRQKAKMVRMCPAEGFALTITEHRSREIQRKPRTAEDTAAERSRKLELARRRALPEGDPEWLPPAAKRGSQRQLGRVRRRGSMGLVRVR